MIKKISLADNLSLSRFVQGHWRIDKWDLSSQELLSLTKKEIELGITSFDHADIYGDYTCESIFGNSLKLDSSLRGNIQLITKCGIKLISNKYPERKIKSYDLTYDHIIKSAENSLRHLQTDYIDLLLLHRPAPFYDPNEIAKAFDDLQKSGKVLQFGVSNFSAQQFDILDSFTEEPLVTNQIEISPYCLEHFDNGNIEFCLGHHIKPMAWSPLAGGRIFDMKDEKASRIQAILSILSEKYNVSIDTIVFAWLLQHPVRMLPILGTGKLDRIINAIKALDIRMTLEDWYSIYIASKGEELP